MQGVLENDNYVLLQWRVVAGTFTFFIVSGVRDFQVTFLVTKVVDFVCRFRLSISMCNEQAFVKSWVIDTVIADDNEF